MSKKDAVRFISDELYKAIDISDNMISEFIYDLAMSSPSSSELFQKLKDTEAIELTDEKLSNFAKLIWTRVASSKYASNKLSGDEKRNRQAFELNQKIKSYKPIIAEEE